MLHKNVLCQTDLTMAELEKIEQELKILTTKLQCSKQEQKLGMSAEKKRELLKSDESAKFNTDIPSLMCFIFLFNTLLGQKQISTVTPLPKRRPKEKAWKKMFS